MDPLTIIILIISTKNNSNIGRCNIDIINDYRHLYQGIAICKFLVLSMVRVGVSGLYYPYQNKLSTHPPHPPVRDRIRTATFLPILLPSIFVQLMIFVHFYTLFKLCNMDTNGKRIWCLCYIFPKIK